MRTGNRQQHADSRNKSIQEQKLNSAQAKLGMCLEVMRR
jgi:hypothetical protein